jgi:Arf-GAP with coiled-coil, ANK repeat and PH domain-containing protein
MACEYMLLNGAKIDTPDQLGYTALHLATEKGHTAQAYLLLKHKAKHDIETKDGKRPIDIAVKLANADIVTLLRLTQLNEEIGEDPEDSGNDATYMDVMKDFSHLTSSNQLRKGEKAKTEGGGGGTASETGEGSI